MKDRKDTKDYKDSKKAWYHDIKVLNLPVLICARNPEHKFIRTMKGQRICPFCRKGKPYPPRISLGKIDDMLGYDMDTIDLE